MASLNNWEQLEYPVRSSQICPAFDMWWTDQESAEVKLVMSHWGGDGSPGQPYFTPFSVFTLVFIPVAVAVSPMALDDQAGIRRSIQPECAKPRALVLPCAAGLMEMNILGHNSAQNSEQSWRQSSGSPRDHGQDSTEMGWTRLSEGLMALGVRRSTFLAEEKHMQPDGGGSGGGVGSGTFRLPRVGATLGEPGGCCTKVTFTASCAPSLPP